MKDFLRNNFLWISIIFISILIITIVMLTHTKVNDSTSYDDYVNTEDTSGDVIYTPGIVEVENSHILEELPIEYYNAFYASVPKDFEDFYGTIIIDSLDGYNIKAHTNSVTITFEYSNGIYIMCME